MNDSNVVPMFPMVDRPSRRGDDSGDPPGDRPEGLPHDRGGPRSSDLREVIGDVLRDERHDQDRTLAEVARDAAVSLPYLSEVERGVKDVSSEVLTSIADALELPLDVLLDRAARRLRVGSQRDTGIQLRAA